MAEGSDNTAIGTTFVLAGVGVMLSLGLTVGWVFVPAGAALVVVGLTYFVKDKGEDAE